METSLSIYNADNLHCITGDRNRQSYNVDSKWLASPWHQPIVEPRIHQVVMRAYRPPTDRTDTKPQPKLTDEERRNNRIEMVMKHIHVSREKAIELLALHNDSVVDAIIHGAE